MKVFCRGKKAKMLFADTQRKGGKKNRLQA